MTKSAIEKMVEWLDSKARESVLIKDYWDEAAKKARRLLSEEQAQKPTAPASLVEELEVVCRIMHGAHGKMRVERAREMIQTAISRYRPAPSSDEDCFSGLETAIKHYRDNGIDSMGLEAIESHIRLSRHPSTKSDRCAELVKELEVMLDGRNDYFMHLNGEAMKNRAFIPKQMIQELVSEFSEDADGKEGK